MNEILNAIESGLCKERSKRGISLHSDGAIFGRASTLNKDCLRALWYEARDYPKEGVSPGSEMVFETGHMWHRQIREWLKAGGVEITDEEREVKFSIHDIYITGHIDGIVVIGGKKYLFDIKSASDYAFKMAGTEPPEPSYARQLALYAVGLREQGILIDGAFLLYVAKSKKNIPTAALTLSGRTESIGDYFKIVPVDVWRIAEEAVGRLALLRLPEPPERLPADKEGKYRFRVARQKGEKRMFDKAAETKERIAILPWQCAYCHFIQSCRPNAQAAFKRGTEKQKWFERDPLTAGPFDSWKVFEANNATE